MTDESALHYKFREKEAAEEVERFASAADVSDLRNDISVLRYLIQQSVNDKSPHLASVLMTTLSRLTPAHDRKLAEQREMLAKVIVMQLARQIINVITEEFVGIPNFEQRIDRAVERITNEIERAENPKDLIPTP
jgi:hypothetical protein